MHWSASIFPCPYIWRFSLTSIDLISKPLGSRILSCSDEWFAAAENLITPTPPVRKPGVFTHAGAWYDGWETRRHNSDPFDWVVIQLGVASGRILGIEIDTAFFDGNHAPEIAIMGCNMQASNEFVGQADFYGWETVLPKQECGPNRRQAWRFTQPSEQTYTHVRLQMYPDGGIARFRLYGVACPVFPQDINSQFDLAAAVNGAVAVSCSDEHFGRKDNLLLRGRGVDMGDGWETKRTRGAHIDWVVVRLGTKGYIDGIVVDTAHFRGNFPKEVQVFATLWEGGGDPDAYTANWVEILSPHRTAADTEHEYGPSVLRNVQNYAFTHAKLVIIPDGGVKRFRILGRRAI
jgi:allantoicase